MENEKQNGAALPSHDLLSLGLSVEDAAKELLVHAMEFRGDWRKGDFTLPSLAQCDMESMETKFEPLWDALKAVANYRLRNRINLRDNGSSEVARAAGPDQATHTIPPQSCRSATKGVVEWHPATEPPDAEISVLVATADGDCDSGFWDGNRWHFDEGRPCDGVTYWADFPEPPPQSDAEEDESHPCPKCGWDDFWFSRCEPMGYFCENCGAPESDERSGSRNGGALGPATHGGGQPEES